jgi:polyhydroxybutyrate depolymerase
VRAVIPAGDKDTWVQLAGVFDGGNWRLYRNGVQVGSSVSGQGASPVNAPWAIGDRWQAGGPRLQPPAVHGDRRSGAGGRFAHPGRLTASIESGVEGWMDITGELGTGDRQRTFSLRLPDSQPPLGLAIVLHGNHSSATGQMMRDWTTFDTHGEAYGLAIAYPDGVGGCWADGRGVTTAEEAGVDDVAFLRAVIDWTADRYGTPADRTIVAGLSNGAFMAHRMGVECGDQVAVFAAAAGTMPVAFLATEPTHAVSAMLIHGTADPLASIEGGYSRHRGPHGEVRGRTLSLARSAERWRTIDRCSDQATRTTEFSSRTTWSGGVGGTAVVSWTVFGGGHAWPGAAPLPRPPGAPASTTEFDAAEEVCRFASARLLPAAARLR